MFFSFILLFSFPSILRAQYFSCGNENELNPPTNLQTSDDCFLGGSGVVPNGNNDIDLLEKYYPDENTPIKKIKIKLWVMQFSENDPRNFIDIAEHRNHLKSIISWANSTLSNLAPAHYGSPVPTPYPTGQPHIPDARIQFELEEENIEFVVDPIGWTNNNSSCSSYCYNNYGKDDCYFDIFVIGPASNSGCAPGFGPHYHVVTDYWGYYLECTTPPFDCDIEAVHKSRNILHEFGHNFGLRHSWEGQFSDILCPHCAGNRSGNCADPNNCSTGCYPSQDAKCLNNIMAYTWHEKKNFTPLQLAAMHVRGFTRERAQYLSLEFDPNATITISGSEVWETARIIPGNIVVEEGAKLTVKCKLIMAPNAIVEVEKGAELVVDGGHITATSPKCGEYWGGIIVEGDGGPNFLYSQGLVTLENEALIEYAQTGVQLKKGAALRAIDSHIKDCRFGVYFHPYVNPVYDNYNPSRIENTTFSVTDDHTLSLQPLLSLRGIKNLNIYGCQFLDERTEYIDVPYYYNLVSTGIASSDSHFKVQGEGTLFSGLLKGIEAGVEGTARNYTVKNATFDDCFIGIISRDVNYFTIKDNLFELGGYNLSPIPQDDNTPPTLLEGVGISLQTGSGFELYDNTFKGKIQVNTLGIFATNTGSEANSIRRNLFDRTTIGNWAQGFNGGGLAGGLEYRCNSNVGSGHLFDFHVEDEGSIGILQGRADIAAGNTFHQSNPVSNSDFRNAPDANVVRYFYYFEQGVVEDEEPIYFSNIEKINVNEENPDCSGGGGGHEEYLTEEQRIYYNNQFNSAKAAYDNTRAYYEAALDGGNSAQLLADIDNPSDLNALKAELQNISPYLSVAAIEAIARQHSLTNAEAVGFSIANPEALRSAQLIDYIQTQRTLNSTQLSMLESARDTIYTERDSVEQQLYVQYADMQSAGRALIIDLLATPDSSIDMTSYKNRLSLQDGLASDYSKVQLHYELGETTEAGLLLQQIENDRIRPGHLQEEFDHYESLKNLHNQLLSSGRDWTGLDEAEIGQLEILAAAAQQRAGAQARHILNLFYGYNYLNLPELPLPAQPLQSSEGDNEPKEQQRAKVKPISEASLEAVPNPASHQVRFEYSVEASTPYVRLQVFDINGRPVINQRLIGASGQYTWNPGLSLAEGVYLYTLEYEGKQLPMKRLVLLR
jgi:hypothetical protein